ncbi:MAG: septation protein IspZ [Steroidobacteraceae bacterium]
MQALLDFAPLAAFLIAYYAAGFYAATAVLMAGMALLLAVDYLRTRRISPMRGASAALVFALGSATLLLHDQRFIQWKPTVFFWALSLAFLASTWIGARPLAQRLFEAALGPIGRLRRSDWQRLNFSWVVFYALLGAINLYVAWHASERAWVNFKVFGLTGATLVFAIAQAAWLARRSEPTEESARPAGPAAVQPDASTIRVALASAFAPADVEVQDDSVAHAGHVGAREGGHFRVTITSNRFAGLATRERHRLVYAALGAWMGRGIHALSIEARSPAENT